MPLLDILSEGKKPFFPVTKSVGLAVIPYNNFPRKYLWKTVATHVIHDNPQQLKTGEKYLLLSGHPPYQWADLSKHRFRLLLGEMWN